MRSPIAQALQVLLSPIALQVLAILRSRFAQALQVSITMELLKNGMLLVKVVLGIPTQVITPSTVLTVRSQRPVR